MRSPGEFVREKMEANNLLKCEAKDCSILLQNK